MEDSDRSETVLLLIDLINPFDYPGGDMLLRHTKEIVPQVQSLKAAFAREKLATIYVNDNFGRWRSSFADTVKHCLERDGKDIARALQPDETDYFVLKPHRSGFYGTPLELLLQKLGVRRVVCAGIATDMCVFATASDAQIRGFETLIASDCSAAMDPQRHERALEVMRQGLGALTMRGCEIPGLEPSD
jgi:nicotinamidase-related amidase